MLQFTLFIARANLCRERRDASSGWYSWGNTSDASNKDAHKLWFNEKRGYSYARCDDHGMERNETNQTPLLLGLWSVDEG